MPEADQQPHGSVKVRGMEISRKTVQRPDLDTMWKRSVPAIVGHRWRQSSATGGRQGAGAEKAALAPPGMEEKEAAN